MDETAANAIPADIVVDLPAALYTNGTTDETPNPTSRNPRVALTRYGKNTAIARPVAIITPLNCSIFFLPIRLASQSPVKRPPVMVAINAT